VQTTIDVGPLTPYVQLIVSISDTVFFSVCMSLIHNHSCIGYYGPGRGGSFRRDCSSLICRHKCELSSILAKWLRPATPAFLWHVSYALHTIQLASELVLPCQTPTGLQLFNLPKTFRVFLLYNNTTSPRSSAVSTGSFHLTFPHPVALLG